MSCRCKDAKMHAFYVAGGNFCWCWPKVDLGLRAASRGHRVMLNRYPHSVIGVAMYVRGWGIGLRWKNSCRPVRRGLTLDGELSA